MRRPRCEAERSRLELITELKCCLPEVTLHSAPISLAKASHVAAPTFMGQRNKGEPVENLMSQSLRNGGSEGALVFHT